MVFRANSTDVAFWPIFDCANGIGKKNIADLGRKKKSSTNLDKKQFKPTSTKKDSRSLYPK